MNKQEIIEQIEELKQRIEQLEKEVKTDGFCRKKMLCIDFIEPPFVDFHITIVIQKLGQIEVNKQAKSISVLIQMHY